MTSNPFNTSYANDTVMAATAGIKAVRMIETLRGRVADLAVTPGSWQAQARVLEAEEMAAWYATRAAHLGLEVLGRAASDEEAIAEQDRYYDMLDMAAAAAEWAYDGQDSDGWLSPLER